MPGRKVRYLGIALSLTVLIGLAADAGAAETRNRVPARQVGVLEWTWDWIAGWFGGQEHGGSRGLSRLRAEASGGLDSNGRCVSVREDVGLGIDPDGGRTSASGDIGMGLDPNGSH